MTRRSAPNNSLGFNPEHSTVVTPFYRESFGDRWLNNGLAVTGSGGTGAALLERSHFYATRRLRPERGHVRRLDEQPG